MKNKDCFGQLDSVFPMGESGLREVDQACFGCAVKTGCLKAALTTKEGLAMRGELVDRAA